LFRDLLGLQHPTYHKALTTKGCVTYCRDDQIALDCAVFQRLPDGTLMLRFRYDNTAFVADWAVGAFHTLQQEYWANPNYQLRLTLTSGQVLIVDNHRMLHGRDSFVDGSGGKGRSLRRVWLARPGLAVLHNAAGQYPDKRALRRFDAYRILERAVEQATPPLSLGIREAADL
jgi:hypothetical protein